MQFINHEIAPDDSSLEYEFFIARVKKTVTKHREDISVRLWLEMGKQIIGQIIKPIYATYTQFEQTTSKIIWSSSKFPILIW